MGLQGFFFRGALLNFFKFNLQPHLCQGAPSRLPDSWETLITQGQLSYSADPVLHC